MSLTETLKSKTPIIIENPIKEKEEEKEVLPIVEKKFYETLPVRYYGEYRILGSNCLPIPKLGDMYMPENQDHLDCLDYQVGNNRISMEKI